MTWLIVEGSTMNKVLAIELTREDQDALLGDLEGTIEFLRQARIIENDHVRETAFDVVESRLKAFAENLEGMLDLAEVIRIEK